MPETASFLLLVGANGLSPLVHSVRGREGISGLYRYDVTISSAALDAVFVETLTGGPATLILSARGGTRLVSGIVQAAEVLGLAAAVDGREGEHRYRVRIVPRAHRLRLRKTSRIFQEVSVETALTEALAHAGVPVRFELDRPGPTRPYLTQYQETDWEFLVRAVSESGMSFCFEQPTLTEPDLDAARALHGVATETLVVRDGVASAPLGALRDAASARKGNSLIFRQRGGLSGPEECVDELVVRQRLVPDRTAFRAFDPERPLQPLVAKFPPEPAATHAPAHVGLEIYEHESRDHFPDWQHAAHEAERMMRRARRARVVATGSCSSVRLAAGHRFDLEDHPIAWMNRGWTVISFELEGTVAFGSDGVSSDCRATFRCVPDDIPYVAKPRSRPAILASLTATVVGPPGEEIHVDDHGQIKVKFHWDRSPDWHDSSCWIRTAQAWAGTGWGSQFLPRVGMEVLVVFENGDPDKPIVVGCLYNRLQPTTFQLPEEKTKSGIRTKSTPNASGHNALVFEDAAGKERIDLVAQRDLDVRVARRRDAIVGDDDSLTVARDRNVRVGKDANTEVLGSRLLSVQADDSTRVAGRRSLHVQRDLEQVVEGRRVERVSGHASSEVSSSSIEIDADATVRVRGAVTVAVGDAEEPACLVTQVDGVLQLTASSQVVIRSQSEILIGCGTSFIRLGPDGVEIVGDTVSVRGGSDARLQLADGEAKLTVSDLFQAVSDDKIVLKSSGASLGLGVQARIDGAKVLLNSPAQGSDDIAIEQVEPMRIALVDQDGEPLPRQRYRVDFEDGRVLTGYLDNDGQAVVAVEGAARVSFPDLRQVERS